MSATALKNWIVPLLARHEGGFILAHAATDGALWEKAVEDSHQFSALMAAPPRQDGIGRGTPEETGFWNLYPAAKTLAEKIAAFQKLYKPRLAAAAGTQTQSGVLRQSPNVWLWEAKFTTKVPDDYHFDTMMHQFQQIPRAQVNLQNAMVFGDGTYQTRYKQSAPPQPPSTTWTAWKNENLGSSFYDAQTNTVVLNIGIGGGAWAGAQTPAGTVDGAGYVGAQGNATDPTKLLDLFQNHATHEAGHAVGARVLKSQGQSGDDMATQWANWKTGVAESAFIAAMWNGAAACAVPATHPAIPNGDAFAFLMSVLKGTPVLPPLPADLPPGMLWNTNAAWLACQTQFGSQKLFQYVNSTGGMGTRGHGYQFPGFTPTSPTAYHRRDDGSYASYDKSAFDKRQGLSWYALSAAPETFAEMYTVKYGTHGTLPDANNGITPATFFTALDAANEADFGPPPAQLRPSDTPPPPTPSGGGGGIIQWLANLFRRIF